MEANTTPEVTTTETSSATVDLRTDTGNITATKAAPADTQVQEYLNIGTSFLTQIFDYIKEFIDDNQKLLVNLLLIFLGVVAVKVTLAIVAAINDIPLLAPMFELVGLGYTGWFVYRYLLTRSSREELGQEFESLKAQVVGKE